ncbi:serine/threonine protein kinase [Plasmodium fragile]|uniref:Serine/threonine protein kinase n=1 Tax=Plasmodium fragile TaxID=5857 RepID=A0A0D9QGA8_PLAFR|nr:serine/threonine protein kinase [Plasmodium fragile]KJP85847.1 serine/threonine protein kinase [Plasmodium fragile]
MDFPDIKKNPKTLNNNSKDNPEVADNYYKRNYIKGRKNEEVKIGSNLSTNNDVLQLPSVLHNQIRIIRTNDSCFKDYVVLNNLGKGTYAQVWKVKHKITNEIFAAKLLQPNQFPKESFNRIVEMFTKEIINLSICQCPGVIKLHKVIGGKEGWILIQDYANDGTLWKENLSSNMTEAFLYFIQLLQGMWYIQDMNIVHRDLKPTNILRYDNKRIVIADFGWSEHIDSCNLHPTEWPGTLEINPPEVLRNTGPMTEKIDNYALGMNMILFISGRFVCRQKGIECSKVAQTILKTVHNLRHSKPPSRFRENLKAWDLFVKLTSSNPSERLSLQNVLDHPWVTEMLNNFSLQNSKFLWHEKVKSRWIYLLSNNWNFFKNISSISPSGANTAAATPHAVYSTNTVNAISLHANGKMKQNVDVDKDDTSPSKGNNKSTVVMDAENAKDKTGNHKYSHACLKNDYEILYYMMKNNFKNRINCCSVKKSDPCTCRSNDSRTKQSRDAKSAVKADQKTGANTYTNDRFLNDDVIGATSATSIHNNNHSSHGNGNALHASPVVYVEDAKKDNFLVIDDDEQNTNQDNIAKKNKDDHIMKKENEAIVINDEEDEEAEQVGQVGQVGEAGDMGGNRAVQNNYVHKKKQQIHHSSLREESKNGKVSQVSHTGQMVNKKGVYHEALSRGQNDQFLHEQVPDIEQGITDGEEEEEDDEEEEDEDEEDDEEEEEEDDDDEEEEDDDDDDDEEEDEEEEEDHDQQHRSKDQRNHNGTLDSKNNQVTSHMKSGKNNNHMKSVRERCYSGSDTYDDFLNYKSKTNEHGYGKSVEVIHNGNGKSGKKGMTPKEDSICQKTNRNVTIDASEEKEEENCSNYKNALDSKAAKWFCAEKDQQMQTEKSVNYKKNMTSHVGNFQDASVTFCESKNVRLSKDQTKGQLAEHVCRRGSTGDEANGVNVEETMDGNERSCKYEGTRERAVPDLEDPQRRGNKWTKGEDSQQDDHAVEGEQDDYEAYDDHDYDEDEANEEEGKEDENYIKIYANNFNIHINKSGKHRKCAKNKDESFSNKVNAILENSKELKKKLKKNLSSLYEMGLNDGGGGEGRGGGGQSVGAYEQKRYQLDPPNVDSVTTCGGIRSINAGGSRVQLSLNQEKAPNGEAINMDTLGKHIHDENTWSKKKKMGNNSFLIAEGKISEKVHYGSAEGHTIADRTNGYHMEDINNKQESFECRPAHLRGYFNKVTEQSTASDICGEMDKPGDVSRSRLIESCVRYMEDSRVKNSHPDRFAAYAEGEYVGDKNKKGYLLQAGRIGDMEKVKSKLPMKDSEQMNQTNWEIFSNNNHTGQCVNDHMNSNKDNEDDKRQRIGNKKGTMMDAVGRIPSKSNLHNYNINQCGNDKGTNYEYENGLSSLLNKKKLHRENHLNSGVDAPTNHYEEQIKAAGGKDGKSSKHMSLSTIIRDDVRQPSANSKPCNDRVKKNEKNFSSNNDPSTHMSDEPNSSNDANDIIINDFMNNTKGGANYDARKKTAQVHIGEFEQTGHCDTSSGNTRHNYCASKKGYDKNEQHYYYYQTKNFTKLAERKNEGADPQGRSFCSVANYDTSYEENECNCSSSSRGVDKSEHSGFMKVLNTLGMQEHCAHSMSSTGSADGSASGSPSDNRHDNGHHNRSDDRSRNPFVPSKATGKDRNSMSLQMEGKAANQGAVSHCAARGNKTFDEVRRSQAVSTHAYLEGSHDRSGGAHNHHHKPSAFLHPTSYTKATIRLDETIRDNFNKTSSSSTYDYSDFDFHFSSNKDNIVDSFNTEYKLTTTREKVTGKKEKKEEKQERLCYNQTGARFQVHN